MSCHEPSSGISQLIERIESGLCPAIRLAGRPAIRWKLAERMARYRVPGVSIAVVNNGELEWARGYGVVQDGSAAAVTAETPFQTASISKPVAALAALRLVEQGRIDLDEDVNTRLKSWRVPDNELTLSRKVTLRGLLSHHAGLTVHGFEGYEATAPIPTLLQVLDGQPPANSAPIRVDVAPGTKGRYSGGGYTVMQQLCIDISGQPFDELMREMVLGPLGMSHSDYAQPLPQPAFAAAAKGHDADGRTFAGGGHIYPELAAAGLWTTPSDLARVILDVQQARACAPGKVISAVMCRQMLTPEWSESQPVDHPLMPPAMGLGFFLTPTADAFYFGHSGGNAGYRSQLLALRDAGQGAVVMTNGALGNLLLQEIFFGIGREYDWPDFQPRALEHAATRPGLRGACQGEYSAGPGEGIRVTAESGRLMARFESLGWIDLELHPVSDAEFLLPELGCRVAFDMNGGGRVGRMRIGERVAAKIR